MTDVDPAAAGAPVEDDQFGASVAELLAAQVRAAGGYDDDSDPEALPTVVFRPQWTQS